EVAAFDFALDRIVVGRIETGGAVRQDNARGPGIELGKAAEFVQREPRLELQIAVALRVLEGARCFYLGSTDTGAQAIDRDPIGGDGGVAIDLHDGGQVAAAQIERDVGQLLDVGKGKVSIDSRGCLRILKIC